MRIGYAYVDSLLTYPDVNNLSTSSQPIRVRGLFSRRACWPRPHAVKPASRRSTAPANRAGYLALRIVGCGRCRSGPGCRWWRGRRARPATSRAQLRMEGCGGEWFGVPVPRLFLYVGALHPIRRQCTSSVRVHRHITGAPPHNGCSAPRACGGCGGCRGCGGLLGLRCLLLGALRGAFVASHVVVPQKCRMQFPHTYFKR